MKSYRKSLTPLGINTRPSNLFVDAGQLNISQPYNAGNPMDAYSNLLAAPANYGVTVKQPNINNLNTSSLGSMVANNMAKLGNSGASGKSGSGFLGLKGASASTIADKAGAGIAGIETLAQNFQKPVFDTETAGKAANAAAATQDTGAGASDSTSLMNAWNSIGFAKDNYTKRDIDKQTGFQKGLGVFNSTASGATAGMSIGGPWGALIGGVAGLGSGLYGMFNRGAQAKKAAKRLNAQADTVNSNLLAGFNNNATNLDISAGQNMLANYSAYGGGLNVLDNQPYYADGGILEGDYDVDNITPEQIMELKRRGYNVDIEDNSFPNGGYVTNQYTADRDVTNVNHQIPALSLLKDRPYIDNQNSIGYSNPYYAKYRNSAVSDKPTATQASQTYWSPVKGAGKRFAASIKSHTNPVNGLLNTVVPAASMATIPMSLAGNIPTLVGDFVGGVAVDELTGGWGKYLEDKTGVPSELGDLTNPGYLIVRNVGRIGRNIYHKNNSSNIYTDGGNTVPYYLAARTSPNNLPEVTVTKRVPKFISDKDKNTYYNIYGNQSEKTAKAWYDTKYGVSQGLNDFGKTWVTPAVMASLPLGEAFSAASKPISAAYNSGKIGARINEAFEATMPGAYIDAVSQMTGLGNKYSLFAPAMKGVNTLKEAATTPYTYLAPKTMAGNIANAATMAGMTYGAVKPAMDNLNVGTGTEAALAVAPLLFGFGKIKMPRAIAHQYYNLRRKYPAVFYNDEGLTRKSKVYGNLSDLASTNSKRDRLNVTNMLTKEGNNILLNTYNQFNDLYKSTGRPIFDPYNYSTGYGYKPILLPSKIASSEPNIINENTPVSFHNPITNTTANGHISTDFLNNTTESQRDLNINFDAVAFRDKMNSGSPLNFLLWDIPELFPNINYRAHKTGTKFPVAYPDKGFEPVRDEINSYYNTMLSKIGDDAIPTGSMVAVNKGYLNRVPGDLDLITTNDRVGSLMNKLNGKITGEKRESGSGSLLGYTAQSPYYLGDGNGELEVINESNGKASGKIAHELYGILHPEEEAALQKQNTLSKNPYYSDELPLPISAEELYQEAKLNKANERKIIQDRQSSYVDKHVEGNQQYIFSDQVPASVYTSNLRDNMTKNVGKGFKMLKDVSPDIDYTNIKENSALLKYLNIPDKDNIIAGNPNTMEKITETLHAEHTLPTRSIDKTQLLPGSTIEDAFTGVNSPKGVNAVGIGSNRIIVNNSSDKWNGGRGAGNSYGDEVGVSQFPLVNDYSKVKYPSDLINGIERRKFPKEIGLTDDEITELEKVMTQNNISIPVKLNTLQDAYNVMKGVDKTPKSEPVNRAFGKILGISGYRGSEYESGLGDYFGGITYDNYPLGIKHGGNYEIPTSINKLSYKNGINELISTPITAAEARNYAKEIANMPGQPSEDYNDLTKLLDFIESTEPSKERVNLFRDFDQNIYFHDPNSESQLEYKDLYNRLFNNDNISPSIKNIKEKVDSMVDRDNVSTKYRNESSKYKSLKEKRAKVLNNSISVLGGTVGTTGVAAIPISMVIMAGSHHPNREENEPVHNYTSENIEQFNQSLQDVTDDTFRNSKKHTKYSFTKEINKRKHK